MVNDDEELEQCAVPASERRKASTELRELKHIRAENQKLHEEHKNTLAETKQELLDHLEATKKEILGVFQKHVDEAFPEGPIYKHKEYHSDKDDTAKTIKKLREDLVAWAARGIIGAVVFLLGSGALSWLNSKLAALNNLPK